MSSKYESKVISDNIWRINDIKNGVSMYLIEGRDKALLIDAGDLKSGLKQYVETLTNKPVELVVTHGHGDHSGCIQEFDTVYFPYQDIEMLNTWFHFDVKKENLIDTSGLKDINLGDIKVEVISLSGHTPGSIALLYREKEFLFTSDGIGSGALWMQLPNCTPLEVYSESLRSLEKQVRDLDDLKICVGHPSKARDYYHKNYLMDLMKLTDQIISGEVVGRPTKKADDFFGGHEASLNEVKSLLYKAYNIFRNNAV